MSQPFFIYSAEVVLKARSHDEGKKAVIGGSVRQDDDCFVRVPRKAKITIEIVGRTVMPYYAVMIVEHP